MTRTIVPGDREEHLEEAVERFRSAGRPAALTGAGISVESGIPDFRSPGGLWTVFAPEEYAGIEVFLQNPEKAWKLYRAMAASLKDRAPNPAHTALADLERAGRLSGTVTQNVDGLHQAAGSREVIEIHGDHQHLQCLSCGALEDVRMEHFEGQGVPRCGACRAYLKPNVVLFGEDVRGMEAISALLEACDLLLVVGTSANVYPAAGLPAVVKERGGLIYEFNLEPTSLTRGETRGGILSLLHPAAGNASRTDFFFEGKASETLTLFTRRVVG